MNKKSGIVLIAGLIIGIATLFFDNRLVDMFKSLENQSISFVLGVFEPMLFAGLFVLLMAVLAFIAKKSYKIILLSPIIAGISAHIIKLIVMRQRPLGLVEYLPFSDIIRVVDYSFPSAHSAIMFALLPILNKEYIRFKWLWWIIAIVVSFARLYFNQHYLSDVIFGAVLGYFIGELMVSRKKK